jgi:PAS domain S-box-containing protein
MVGIENKVAHHHRHHRPKVRSPYIWGSSLTRAVLTRVWDIIPVALHILNSRGIIIAVNAAEATLLGLPKQRIIKRHFTDFIPLEQRADAILRFQEKLRGGKVDVVLHRTCLREGGGKVFVSSVDRVLDSAKGEVLTVLIDITERQELQARLHKLERLAALKGQAGGLAHDFGNLFSAIKLAAGIIRNNLSNATVREEMLGIIDGSCDEALRLIRAIKDYVRGGDGTELVTSFSLGSVVNEALPIFKLLGSGIAVNANLDNMEIKGNAGEIHIALLNLLINARDAGATKIVVEINRITRREEFLTQGGIKLKAGDYVELSVTDNGSGIPEKFRGSIFETLFTTKGVHGSGMGLPMVLATMKEHNGGVTVESAVGVGTTFHLFFPVPQPGSTD